MRRVSFVLVASLALVTMIAGSALAWTTAVVDSTVGDNPPTSLAVSSTSTVGIAWQSNAGSSNLHWGMDGFGMDEDAGDRRAAGARLL